MDRWPDLQQRLQHQVESIEANVSTRPDQCAADARGLLEAVGRTLYTELNLGEIEGKDVTQQMRAVVKALDLEMANHAHGVDIRENLKRLLGSISGAMGALTALSNVPGLRHGANLDWDRLSFRHAAMLGGFCDAFVGFVIEAACLQRPEAPAPDLPRYEDEPGFNARIDDEYDPARVLAAEFPPSFPVRCFAETAELSESTVASLLPDAFGPALLAGRDAP